MELTFIGLIQLLVGGVIVVAGGLRSAFAFLMASGLLGGSAAINLPALGGSSILPEQFALLFVYMRILAPRGGFVGLLPDAIRDNLWLVLFTIYGMACAIILPRIFAGAMEVYPTRMVQMRGIFFTTPLEPTSQNITACVYLLGALLIVIAAWITCRMQGGANRIVSAAISISWVHIALGILVAVTAGTALDAAFDVFRNSNYSQLDAEAGGFVRIRGLFPESSSYSSFAFGYFVLLAELWFRSIRSYATGATALALAAILFMSTSSTAYVGLFAYLVFFVLRAALLPQAMDWRKFKTVLLWMAAGVLATAVLMAIVPGLPAAIYDMIMEMTVKKSESSSGMQRLFWTMQGLDAFVQSYGLGIGPGSFRSSSNLTAILGSMGAAGLIAYLTYLVQVVKPGRLSTWTGISDMRLTIGGAFGCAALLSLVPAAINSTNVHPSTIFATLAGAALALRQRSPAPEPEPKSVAVRELTWADVPMLEHSRKA